VGHVVREAAETFDRHGLDWGPRAGVEQEAERRRVVGISTAPASRKPATGTFHGRADLLDEPKAFRDLTVETGQEALRGKISAGKIFPRNPRRGFPGTRVLLASV